MGYPLNPRPRYPYGPATKFALTGVQPPAAGYLGPADQLTISVLCPNASVTFSVALRFLDLQGNVQPLLTELNVPATGSTPFLLPVQAAEGFLLSATAFNANCKRGQCWVQLLILRQKAADATVVGAALLQGYVSATDVITWPGTPAGSSLDGRGFVYTIAPANPPASTPINFNVPPGVRWRLQSAYIGANLVGAGGQAYLWARNPPVGNYLYATTLVNVVAGTGANISWSAAPLPPTGATAGYNYGSIPPDFQLLAGDEVTIGIFSPNFQISTPTLVVEEWVQV